MPNLTKGNFGFYIIASVLLQTHTLIQLNSIQFRLQPRDTHTFRIIGMKIFKRFFFLFAPRFKNILLLCKGNGDKHRSACLYIYSGYWYGMGTLFGASFRSGALVFKIEMSNFPIELFETLSPSPCMYLSGDGLRVTRKKKKCILSEIKLA